jgi:tetratricopeptide (TPR) repeat protein
LAASLGNQSEAAEAFLDAASVHARQGLYDRALAKVRQAVQIQSTAKINPDWSKKLMGDLLLEMNRPAEAEPYITEAGYDSSAGLLYLAKSQPQTAKKHYEGLLDAATAEQNLDEMFTAHTGLGKVYEATQDYARAKHHYAKAVGITEEIRASLLLSERRNFFAEKVSGFVRSESAKGLARVALKLNNPAASIYAGEVTKAREFADNLSQKTEGRYFDVPPELLEKEAELTNKLAALKTALNAVSKGLDNRRFEEMVNQIKQEDSRRKAFVGTLCQKCKEYCSVKYPQPVLLRDAHINDAEYVLLFDVLGDSVGITLLKGKRVVIPTPFLTGKSQVREIGH